MKFVRATATDAVRAIYERLGADLHADKRVLWLTSGGSNIQLEVEIMNHLRAQSADTLTNLVILPMDERYGPAGHADSNTHQLREAGFDPGAATWIDILARNLPMRETVDYYSETSATELAAAQVVVGQFGIGDDAHVAGIKPNSPATAPGSATVIGYNWSDYERMTMSWEALQQVTVAYLIAFGEGKKEALKRLRSDTEPFEKLPAKLLYDISEAYVYNDQLESEE